MLRHVTIIARYQPVQTLVEQQVGTFRDRLPGGEFTGFLVRAEAVVMVGGLVDVVEVVTLFAGPRFTVGPEQFLELVETVGLRAEVA